jgi:hypothetical protein
LIPFLYFSFPFLTNISSLFNFLNMNPLSLLRNQHAAINTQQSTRSNQHAASGSQYCSYLRFQFLLMLKHQEILLSEHLLLT